MIIESLFNMFMGLIEIIIALLPIPVFDVPNGVAGMGTILAYGLFFFPVDVWVTVITMGVATMVSGLAWAIIEWVYNKVPGIN